MKENWKSKQDPESKKWRCVYATYFDKSLTIKEGRRLPKEMCLDNPNINIISFAMEKLKLKYHIDPIAKHPRDFFGMGRLKVKMLDNDGNPLNSEIGTSKRKLFAKIAEGFPKAQERFDSTVAE
jgi:signal recognition particle subunit SRP19|tara:strand:+ start:321 stop:692 length:372 start_codon:yes stop_codon:yes gene_type:complete